jgi:hypothetical protein
MGLGVSMRGILTLGVCASGFRVPGRNHARVRTVLPGLFCAVEDIRVTRRSVLFWPVAKLKFGSPAIGSLTIFSALGQQAGACGHGALAGDRAVP